MANRRLTCIFFLLILEQLAWSQKIIFEQITTAEGLPSDYVNCVLKDSRGFLWIATDKGACRYDGRNFIYLNRDNGLTSNLVYNITEDPHHNIWLGTFGGGLCRFDGSNITALPLDSAEFKSIFHVHFNPDGSVFLVSGKDHLFYLDSIAGEPKKVSDLTGVAIASHTAGKFIFTGGYKAIYSLSIANHQFLINKIWNAKSDHDILLGMPENNHFIVREADQVVIYQVSADTAKIESKFSQPRMKGEKVGGAYYTKEHELWMSTATGTLYWNDNGETELLSRDNGLGGSDYIKNLYEDDQHTIYLSTYGGGVKIWSKLYLREFKMDGIVNSISLGKKARYVTSTSGIYAYEPRNKFTELKSLSFENFTSSYLSPDGHFYLGTYHSFLKLPAESSLNHLTSQSEKKYEIPLWQGAFSFLSRGRDSILVSVYGEGLCEYDVTNRIVGRLNVDNGRAGSSLIEYLKPLDHSFAALSFDSGLTLTVPGNRTVTISKENGLLSNFAYSVYQEENNEIWIGTQHGLNLWNGERISRTWSYKEGFLGNKVLCIFRDSSKRFWILSDRYLHLLEGNRLRAVRSHPLLYAANTINRAEFDATNQLLYLGLTNAFMVVDIGKIVLDTMIFSPSATISINGVTNSTVSAVTSLHSNDHIGFRFTSALYPLAKHSDLFVKLKGYDESWRLLDDSAEVEYAKLLPGSYEMLARTVNPDGFGSKEISLLKFKIGPPFWNRSWFLILCVMMLLLVIFAATRWFSKNKYERRIRKMQEEHRLQLEKERIARELHDNVGSQLTYLINRIEDDKEILSDATEADHLSNFARGAMRELRETIWALDKKEISVDELGNKVQLLLQLYRTKSCKIELAWQHEPIHPQTLNSLEALNIYRIIQEAINNAVKHSRASEIKVGAVLSGKKIHIIVEDNGKGFDTAHAENGYGLANMKKRSEEMNGKLMIQSFPQKGTSIELIVDRYPEKNHPFS